MLETDKTSRAGAPAIVAAICALGIALGGCSSSGSLFGSLSGGASADGKPVPTSNRIRDLFFGGPAGEDAPPVGEPAAEFECPGIEIRAGASTLSIQASGREPSATGLRYQVTIAQTARECTLAGNTMRMRIGVLGRVILGPAGGPGQIDVPLRYAVVQEGAEPKTIATKMYRIPVTIPAGQTNVPFTHVEEAMTFPMPRPSELDAYVVYIGFDAVAKPEPKAPRGRRAQ